MGNSAFGGITDPTSPAYLANYAQMKPGDFEQTLKGAQQGMYAQGMGDSLYNHSGHFDPVQNAWVGITPRDASMEQGGKQATLAMMTLMGGAGMGAALGGAAGAGADNSTIGDNLMPGAEALPGGEGGTAGGFGQFGKYLKLGKLAMGGMGGSRGGGQRQMQAMPFVNRMPQAGGFVPINRPKSQQQLLIEEMQRGAA